MLGRGNVFRGIFLFPVPATDSGRIGRAADSLLMMSGNDFGSMIWSPRLDFYVLRSCWGCEAGFFPGMILYLRLVPATLALAHALL